MSGGLENYEGRLFCALPDSLLGASAAGDLCRWTKAGTQPVTWWLANDWPGFTLDAIAAAFTTAFGMWSDVCNIHFERTDHQPADITIYSRNMGAPGGVLAEALLPCPAGNSPLWARFDNSEPWIVAANPPANKIDLIRVAAHEIGHSLGCGHLPAGSQNLMAPTYSTRIGKPQAGDIAEVVARYGLPHPVDPTDPPDPPASESIYIRLPKAWVVEPPTE